MGSIYTTALSPDEVRRRIQAYSKPVGSPLQRMISRPAPGVVVAKMLGDRFRLYAAGPKFVQNSFAPFFYGRIERKGNGSRIHGRLGLHPFVRIFIALWFGGLFMMFILFLVLSMTERIQMEKPPPMVIIAPLLMALFGVGLIFVGQRLGRSQRERLEQFLREDLEARPAR